MYFIPTRITQLDEYMSLHIYNKNEDMNANGGFNNCINDIMTLIVIKS